MSPISTFVINTLTLKLNCTPSGPVRPRLIQHELLVVLSLINIVTDDCGLYTIWSSVAKVNTT